IWLCSVRDHASAQRRGDALHIAAAARAGCECGQGCRPERIEEQCPGWALRAHPDREDAMARPPKRAQKNKLQTAPGSLAESIVASPVLSDAKQPRAKVSAWISEIARTAAGKLIKDYVSGSPALRALIEGVADGSPYLWELLSGDPARLLAVLEADPEQHFDTLLAGTAAAVAASDSEAEAMRLLRGMKAEAALLVALADIGGVWPVMRVTAALTRAADAAVRSAVRFLIRDAVSRGKLLATNATDADDGCGLIVLAMGKMGAQELNYSSDIDLIVLFDPHAPAVPADV